MPIRIFTVTGTPAGAATRTAWATIAVNRPSFQGRAEPPPLRVTLGTGQPKLRSMWSARSSSTSSRTAAATVPGSTPYSCTERGASSASWAIRRIDSTLRSSRAREVTISLTNSPSPSALPTPRAISSRQSRR